MRLMVSGTTASLRSLLPKYQEYLGFLLVPGSGNKIESVLSLGIPWACDNGAFNSLDVNAYLKMICRIRLCLHPPEWITCPDKVANATETIRLWHRWAPFLREIGLNPCFVIQDGQEAFDLPVASAYFVGGSTKFKLSQTAADLALFSTRDGASLHMGRVNSRKRLQTAYDMGCDTVDGTGLSRWGDVNIEKFCRWIMRLKEQPLYEFQAITVAKETDQERQLPVLR